MAEGLNRSKSDQASSLADYPPSCGEPAIPPAKTKAKTKASVVQRIRHVASSVYQKAVVEAILQRGQLAASKDGRKIPLRIDNDEALIDSRRGQAYISNSIRTSRYTLWNFVPKQLLFQFTRIGNFYFLCVGIPQMIPGLSTTGSYTTILPLLFFVCLTMFKEGFDDYRRHRLDKVENANFATVLGKEDKYTGKTKRAHFLDRFNPFHTKTTSEPRPVPAEEFQGVRWVPTRWADIKVGDVIRLARDEPVPADIALIYSDGENNLAYVDTMALDGETNLKSKQVCHALEGCGTIQGIAKCGAEFVAEDPNPDLFNFNGKVTVNEKAVPLTLNEIVYRGSVLRNTTCAIGIVLNTGEECKLRMNSNRHPKAKKPALERVVNRIVITLAFYVVILSVGVSMGYILWQRSTERHSWYLAHASVPFHEVIIAFIIMFNNVIPLSLYVSLEIVKVGQLLLLNSDVEMYDEESDTPARCNTNTILENLGQVGYIFSDKTGTLTDNVMKFRKLSVAGTVWLHEMDLEPQPSQIDGSDTTSSIVKVDVPSRAPSVNRRDRTSVVIHEESLDNVDTPMSPRPSMAGRRSSSQWRSTGRPDHVQPDVNTSDLLEYMKLRPHSAFTRKTKEYLLAMALCHSCLPEQKDGKIDFQASSPDELALVRAAQELGYLVVQRNSKQITLQVTQTDGSVELLKYEILDIIEFSSARKRMSIVVRYPDGRISVICKGADSAILPRLRLSSLAMQKATEVRQSADLEHERFRRSEQLEPRNSFGGRPSLSVRRNPTITRERSVHRPSMGNRSKSFELNKLTRRSEERPRPSFNLNSRGASFDISNRHLLSPMTPHAPQPLDPRLSFLEDSGIFDESEVFTKCFKHLDDFATEGLRTLLFAQKFVSEQEYRSWKKLYDDATTSLTNRQEKIEAAGEMIEQAFELVGGSAIEDKLQKGVPETIDRLRRANIKIWMLTGDKRETAINIAHSARICRPGSDVYIIDATKGSLETQLSAMAEDLTVGSIHSVVVIDGQTLAAVEKSEALSVQFFAIMLRVDSVICCRASPAQKALLVRTVRSKLKAYRGKNRRGLTLAIGDGANDLAMIQASHVGIGISGKEGLQAARVADYAIAQFRFLQRLLLVHGRWNYVRTAKFIVCTFWKEMFFYLPAAQYQRYNGYTGTSLYQSASLTVFNTLFTSLCTICMGIWEQDLRAETLLAIPELYIYGQRNMGLNFWKYMRWMLLAAIEGVITWNGIWAGYGWVTPAAKDENLYALGSLVFTVGVFYSGWFAWLAFLDGVYAATPSGDYDIRHTFTRLWGADAVWWSTVFIVLAFMGMMELLFKAAKRAMLVAGLWHWPPWQQRRARLRDNVEEWELELWQEMEQDEAVRRKLARMARDDGDDGDVGVGTILDGDDDVIRVGGEDEDVLEQIEVDISRRS
ncbi:phospholipid-translocating P-type ATPase [Trichoderma citrinoviride]|uniref:Phospholipid-transporting ATPase n=1 Tax=Trichoderma citrinoviride TaxID=58853 RepID=A0A2T4BCS7_9HYPO|nr:phospholipid-translocating P-type ATPase [Trichoderma citrinoviride]PTB66999.1 phospholipid-translocating P-type ATPase [Trichoderma citrinoviride]